MRTLLLIILLFTPMMVPFETAAPVVVYTSDNVEVSVDLIAAIPWTAPFEEEVNLTIGVFPLVNNVIHVNITSVNIIVYREEADQSGYRLITAKDHQGTPLAEGTTFANYTDTFLLSGTDYGTDCYFALLVEGYYYNATHLEFYQALSDENLIGPFVIGSSIHTPVAYVGLIVLAIAGVVFIAGVYGIKKSRSRSTRKSLMDSE